MKRTPPFAARIGASALRVWIAFSVSSFVVATAFSILDGDNPLRSDDPYIPGFLAAMFTSSFSLCWVAADWLGSSVSKQHFAYFVPLVLLVGLLLIWDFVFPPIEGQGLPTFLAIAVSVGGVAAYPFHFLKLVRASVILASIPGIVCLIGYSCARITMAIAN